MFIRRCWFNNELMRCLLRPNHGLNVHTCSCLDISLCSACVGWAEKKAMKCKQSIAEDTITIIKDVRYETGITFSSKWIIFDLYPFIWPYFYQGRGFWQTILSKNFPKAHFLIFPPSLPLPFKEVLRQYHASKYLKF